MVYTSGMTTKGWHGGPYSKDFPERVAARMVTEGVLRLDPDGSVWRVRMYEPGMVKSFPMPKGPRRIDYPTKRGNRYFEIRVPASGHSEGAPTGQARPVKVQVSRLIWQLTHGDIPDKLTVNHKDGNPTHNVLDNFELMTHSEQHIHRHRVLGQESPSAVNKKLAALLAEAARVALDSGDLDPLRVALKTYDGRAYGPMAKYKDQATARRKTNPLHEAQDAALTKLEESF